MERTKKDHTINKMESISKDRTEEDRHHLKQIKTPTTTNSIMDLGLVKTELKSH